MGSGAEVTRRTTRGRALLGGLLVALVAALLPAAKAEAVGTSGIITTVAGTGTAGSSGDGAAATSAQIAARHAAVAPHGSPYAGDVFFTQDRTVRRLTPGGDIHLFAGGGSSFTEGGDALDVQLPGLTGIDVAADGTVYVVGGFPGGLYRIDPVGRVYTMVASGTSGPDGYVWDDPEGIAVDPSGNVYVAVVNNHKVYKVTSAGDISVFYGTGNLGCVSEGYRNDAGEWVITGFRAQKPNDVAVSGDGSTVYINDRTNSLIWAVPAGNRFTRTMVSGTTTWCEADPANFDIPYPVGIDVDDHGAVYVAGRGAAFDLSHRVYRIAGGSLATIAGTGEDGFSGDGGPAVDAKTAYPRGVAVTEDGTVFFGTGDTSYGSSPGATRIRMVADPPPPPLAGLSISDVTIAEGDKRPRVALFTVSLPEALESSVTVDWATADGSGDHAAVAPADYVAKSGSLTIPAGQLSRRVAVPVKGEHAVEDDEVFVVRLSNANVPVAKDIGVGVIEDDDGPRLAVSDATIVEGDSGVRTALFTVSLSAAASEAVTVGYETSDGSAVAPQDYVSKSGTLTFNAGQRSKVVAVPVRGNTVNEADEVFHLGLVGHVDVPVLDRHGVGTIVNDDAAPSTGASLSISDATVSEGDTGWRLAYFTVSLSDAVSSSVTVDYATADGIAVAPGDYVAKSGSVTIPAGQLSRRVAVPVKGKRADEPDESFTVNLSNANITVADATGTGTIVNDDGPMLAVSDVTIAEGHDGLRLAAYTISLSTPAATSVTVNYETVDIISAAAGRDYVAKSGTLTIPSGQRHRIVTVAIKGDTTDETDEYFGLGISNGSVPIIRDFGFTLITDDDPTPS